MDNKNIKSILQDALEERVPSAQIELWPAVKASLVTGKHPLTGQGEKMNSNQTAPHISRRIYHGDDHRFIGARPYHTAGTCLCAKHLAILCAFAE